MTKIVASIEARMGSSRLPGKVMLDIEGKPAIGRLIERLNKSKLIDDLIIATTTNVKDDILCNWAEKNNIHYYRGDEYNVLNRVFNAHLMMSSDHVVEVTGDCPLIDHEIIDQGIEIYLSNDYDVVTNVVKPSYSQGIDVQIFKFELLKWVEENINDRVVKEHVSIHFYENPHKYKTYHMLAPKELYAPNIRMQLDYKEDLIFIKKIYKYLLPEKGFSFSYKDILQLLIEKPKLLEINKNCKEKKIR